MWKILVVEDDPHQLNACVNRLKLSPALYTIDTASNADDAITKLEKEVYDVVITDLRMPTEDKGFSVIKKIKEKDPEFSRTKVVVLTVVGAENPKEGIPALRLALQYGVEDYIIKGKDNYLETLDLTIQKVMLKYDVSLIEQGQVFINSPYDEHHNAIYEKLKKEAEHSVFVIIRADDRFHGNFLKEEIYHQIEESEFVIAFISGLNSNVMYELGLAHGMGKKVIIVKDEKTSLVSDLKGIQYLSYNRDNPFKIIEDILKALEGFSPDQT